MMLKRCKRAYAHLFLVVMPKLKLYLIETKEVMLDALSTGLRGGPRPGEPAYYVQQFSCLTAFSGLLVGGMGFLMSSSPSFDHNSVELAKTMLEIGGFGVATFVGSSTINAFKNIRRRK